MLVTRSTNKRPPASQASVTRVASPLHSSLNAHQEKAVLYEAGVHFPRNTVGMQRLRQQGRGLLERFSPKNWMHRLPVHPLGATYCRGGQLEVETSSLGPLASSGLGGGGVISG